MGKQKRSGQCASSWLQDRSNRKAGRDTVNRVHSPFGMLGQVPSYRSHPLLVSLPGVMMRDVVGSTTAGHLR